MKLGSSEGFTSSSLHPAQPSALPASMAWIPLEGLAQTWATFAGSFLTPAAFMATSMAFSALSLEADALREYRETCRCRYNGDILMARTACEHVIQDLQEGSSQWMRALFWLERLAADEPQHGKEEEARMRAVRGDHRTTRAPASPHLPGARGGGAAPSTCGSACWWERQ